MDGEEERPAQGDEERPPAPGAEEQPPAQHEQEPERRRGALRHLVTVAVAAGVLLFALAFFMAGFAARTLLDEDASSDSGSGMEAITAGIAEHDPAWGPEDAAVVIQEFADFQCPYCSKFALETYPQLKAAYEDKVRFVFRDFPLSAAHGSAQKAAEAAQCAQDQGLFWEYHDLLFAQQDAMTDSDLRGYAEAAGADTAKFDDCLDSGKNTREVLLDAQDGRRLGVTGTPAFLVNDLLLGGAQPYEQFQLVIDQALVVAGAV